jgi:hypothetical protein
VGGFRFTPIGSVDGGFELLVEFWSMRAFRSWACRSDSAIRRSRPATMARASPEKVSQMC